MPITIEKATDNDLPVLLIHGLRISHPNLSNGCDDVVAVIETAVAPPQEDMKQFEEWLIEQARSAINCKDDRIAARPSIWPDGSEHTVYRVWRNRGLTADTEQISVWSTPATPDL